MSETVMTEPTPTPDARRDRIRRRRRNGFRNHLLIYFAVMVVLIPVNLLVFPGQPWVLLPMVGWAGPLAIHAAWVMELFGPPRA